MFVVQEMTNRQDHGVQPTQRNIDEVTEHLLMIDVGLFDFHFGHQGHDTGLGNELAHLEQEFLLLGRIVQ